MMKRKITLRERLERIFDRETWEQNNAPIPHMTAQEQIEENHRIYHAQTYTALYLKTTF